jgi:hypothetical protein
MSEVPLARRQRGIFWLTNSRKCSEGCKRVHYRASCQIDVLGVGGWEKKALAVLARARGASLSWLSTLELTVPDLSFFHKLAEAGPSDPLSRFKLYEPRQTRPNRSSEQYAVGLLGPNVS